MRMLLDAICQGQGLPAVLNSVNNLDMGSGRHPTASKPLITSATQFDSSSQADFKC
jgi:hypothetical protein